MLIIGILIALIVVGAIFIRYEKEMVGEVLFFMGCVLLFIALIFLPISISITNSEIERFKSVQATIAKTREKEVNLESAAIQLKIIEVNAWLASAKYWNTSILDIWVPDKIEKLRPIE